MPPSANGVKVISIGMFTPGNYAPVVWRGDANTSQLQQFTGGRVLGRPGRPAARPAAQEPAASRSPSRSSCRTPDPGRDDPSAGGRRGGGAGGVPPPSRPTRRSSAWSGACHGLPCPALRQMVDVFGTGGGQSVADGLTRTTGASVPVLGSIPIDVRLREGAATEPAVVLTDPDSQRARPCARSPGSWAGFLQRGLSRLSLGITPKNRFLTLRTGLYVRGWGAVRRDGALLVCARRPRVRRLRRTRRCHLTTEKASPYALTPCRRRPGGRPARWNRRAPSRTRPGSGTASARRPRGRDSVDQSSPPRSSARTHAVSVCCSSQSSRSEWSIWPGQVKDSSPTPASHAADDTGWPPAAPSAVGAAPVGVGRDGHDDRELLLGVLLVAGHVLVAHRRFVAVPDRAVLHRPVGRRTDLHQPAPPVKASSRAVPREGRTQVGRRSSSRAEGTSCPSSVPRRLRDRPDSSSPCARTSPRLVGPERPAPFGRTRPVRTTTRAAIATPLAATGKSPGAWVARASPSGPVRPVRSVRRVTYGEGVGSRDVRGRGTDSGGVRVEGRAVDRWRGLGLLGHVDATAGGSDAEEPDGGSDSRPWTASVTSAISFFRSGQAVADLHGPSSLVAPTALRMNVLGLGPLELEVLELGPTPAGGCPLLGAVRELPDLSD